MRYFWGADFKIIDKNRGRLLIGAAASAGFPLATAYCHIFGWNGLDVNNKLAYQICVNVAETTGYHLAMFMMGYCAISGFQTSISMPEAVNWFTKAAAEGNSWARNWLAWCYQNGEGCEQDKKKAVALYEQSAESGNCNAMEKLGSFYQNGTGGVTEDLNKAREWYTKAVALGNVDAKEQLQSCNADI